MEDLTVDREFAAFWPELTEEAEAKLLANLQSDGCTDPIITWANHQGIILDGYHRYKLCRKNKIKFATKAIVLPTREAALQWIFDRQLGRRNITESQRAYCAALLVNSHTEAGGGATVAPPETVAEAAEKAGVSERLVQYAGKVRDAGSKELKEAVRDGDIPAAQAAVIAELPKVEQKKLVEKGADAVAAKVKKLKAAGKPKQSTIDKPKEYKDSFDPSELSGESKDAFGKDVPSELAQAFELRNGFKEQRDKLTSIKSWITQNIKHSGATILASAQQRLVADIDNADRELKFSMPHCVCIYCKNKSPKVANCNACKGTGWINESVFKAAPKGMR